MKIYKLTNSEYRTWIVFAENEEQAWSLVPEQQKIPFEYGSPYRRGKTAELTIEEIDLNEAKVVMSVIRHEEW